MPGKQNGKQNRKQARRGGGKKARSAASIGPVGTVTVPPGYGAAAFPVAIRTKQRYFQQFTLNGAGANILGEYVWRTNSAYDPDFTGVGTQPSGYAALATLYNYYRVIGSTWTFTAVSDVSGTTSVTIVETPTSTAFGNYSAAAQQGFAINHLLAEQTAGGAKLRRVLRIKPWVVHGVTKERYMNDDQFAAAVTTSPVQSSFVHFVVLAMTVTASIQLSVDVSFDVVFYDRVLLN